MAAEAADHNLLFGLLALQNGLIDQVQLVATFQAWTRDKTHSLADHLVARGDLDGDDRAAVEALVARHIKKHGDVEKSLAAVPTGRSTREELAALGDPQVEASLANVGSGSTERDDRTANYSVGTATSDGQRFRVLRPHARGGLGAVFVALDEELHREVALKEILDQHADDPASRSRFLLEAEITGGLEHPGIVPVYGLGSHSDGRPYYAMRLIRGDSLKEAIERFHADERLRRDPGRRSLELRKLLRRYLDVCNAIDYAHSRGVLHRNIKPGNIIVGKHGETLVVDWGLAKPLGHAEPDQESGERTLMPSSASGSAETLPGSAMGTPAYMSPEQAAGNLDRLGPRSDVYSLGATLYNLLTGKRPFEGDDVGAVLREIQKGEFPPPRWLDPSIDRALEAVCLKAMALKPENRYATPTALTDDLERWMADEPVSARRDGWAARAWRWVRKHHALATTAAASVAVLLVMASALAVQQSRAADRERRIAGRERQARTDEQLARSQAQDRLGQIENAIELLASIFKDLDPRAAEKEGKALQAILAERLNRAAAQLDAEAIGDSLAVAELQEIIGVSQTNLGYPEKAIAILTRALQTSEARLGPDHPDTLTSRDSLASAYSAAGRLVDAIAIHEETLRLRSAKLGRDHSDTLNSRSDLAVSYRSAGLLDDAIALHEETLKLRAAKLGPDNLKTLQTRNNLGLAYSSAGRLVEAIAMDEETLKLATAKLGPDHPETLQSRNNLGLAYWSTGRLDEAIATHEETLELRTAKLGPLHPNTLTSRHNLALAYQAAGRLDKAIPMFEETLKHRAAKLGPDHTETLISRNCLALAYWSAGRRVEAIAIQEETLKLSMAKLGPNHDTTLTSRNFLATAYREAGRLVDAESLLRDVLERRRRSSRSGSRELAAAIVDLGWVLVLREKGSEAEPLLRECLPFFEKALSDDWRRFQIVSLLGGAMLGQGKYNEAEPLVVRGYEGLKAREAKIRVTEKARLWEAAERVVRLYESWGKPEQAAAWKKKLGLADLPADVFAR